MLELVKEMNLGQWTIFVIVVSVLWKFVFKSLVDSWFKNKLEMQKQEVGIALLIQKNIAVKQAEFEKIKLERVLPLLEEVNSALSEHRMMFSNYSSYIVNKCGTIDKIEQERLIQDKRIIKAMSSLSIYLPEEFRELIFQLRKVVSCSWRDPVTIYRVLHDIGDTRNIPSLANDLYDDLSNAYYSMCNKYLGVLEENVSYTSILKSNDLDLNSYTLKIDPENQLAWKFILLHEYYGSNELVEAQRLVDELYKRKNEYSSGNIAV